METEQLKSITVKVAYATLFTSVIASVLGVYAYFKIGRLAYLALTPLWLGLAVYAWKVSKDLKRA